MKYSCTIQPIAQDQKWPYYAATVKDREGNIVYTFVRNLTPRGNSVFFQFMRHGKQYAITGEAYNAIKIVELPNFDNVVIVPDWDPDWCPLNYRLLNDTWMLVEFIIWGDVGSILAMLNLDTLEIKTIPFEADGVYDFDNIDVTIDQDHYCFNIPCSIYTTLKVDTNDKI